MATEASTTEVKNGDENLANFKAAARPSTTLRKESSHDSAFSEHLSPTSLLGLQSPFLDEGSGEWPRPQSPPPPSVEPHSESLSGAQPPSLKEAMNALKRIVRWEEIAVELGFDSSDIKTIQQYPIDQRKLEMVIKWLDNDADASMEKLYDAIENSKSGAGEGLDREHVSMIKTNETKIKSSFSDLLTTLRNALTRRQAELNADKVHVYLMTICPAVPKASLDDMFDFVTSKEGWDYENYSPLDVLIERFLHSDEVSRASMTNYENELSGFYMSIKLIHYIQRKQWSGRELSEGDRELSLSIQHYQKLEVRLKLTSKITDLTLKYVKELWEKLARRFRIPYSTSIIREIIEGSLVIVWLVLPNVAETITAGASTEKSIEFFLQHEIVYVAIDKQPVFDTIRLLLEIVNRGDWQKLNALVRQYRGLFDLDVPYQDGKSLLIIAAELGEDLPMLTLLDSKVDISFKQESTGKTALFFAAENGHKEATAILLAYGADPRQKDSAGVAALDVATEKTLEEFRPYMSESAVARQPTVRSFSTYERAFIHFLVEVLTVLGRVFRPLRRLRPDLIGATRSDNTNTVEYIVTHTKKDSAARELIKARENDKHGWTALMYASDNGNAKIAEQLLARGADPNESAKSNGWTCLMLASRRGSLQVTKMLLDYGADPNLANSEDVSPLSIALYERRTAVPLLLIHRGADVHFPDQHGWTPLIRASNEGNLKLVKIIADLEANLNDQTNEGWSSLMVSSNYGHIGVVRELANRGAELNLATSAGDTALHLATLRNRPEVVEELAKLGADLNAGNKDGLTALMVAANKNYVEVADALLEGGADPNQPHQETKWTAVFFAAKNGHVEIVKKLLFMHTAKTEILNKDGSTKLSVLDVASYLKQMAILSALGMPDNTASLASRQTMDIENNVKTIDSLIWALEHRFMPLKKALS